jgi:hypothetical protein
MSGERIAPEELDILNDVKREVDLAVAAAQRLMALVSARLVRKYNLTPKDRIEEDGCIVRGGESS